MGHNVHFPDEIIATIRKEKILGIRAGRDSTHRVIGIWAVVVEQRTFIHSWSLKPRSWWRTFWRILMGACLRAIGKFPSGRYKHGASA